ncbi:MAG: hypothetical protein VKL20_04150 [Synechocystis sp.]|nr:hypothetical protein [Synechocystis sp.]
MNLLLAVRLYFYYRQLQGLTRRLNRWERCVQGIFSQAPDNLLTTAQTTQQLKRRYVFLVRRWLKIQGLWQLWRLLPKTGG